MATVVAPPRRLALRHGWIVPGLGLAIFANMLAADHGLGIIPGARVSDRIRPAART
jgi:hypothetical protein